MNCVYCLEEILDDDPAEPINGDGLIHAECFLRMIVGSVGHQLRRCLCYGGHDEDPPGLTRRQGAMAAARLYCAEHSG